MLSMLVTSLVLGSIITLAFVAFIWFATSFIYWDWESPFNWESFRIYIVGDIVITALVFLSLLLEC